MLNNILVFERNHVVKTSYKSEWYRYSALEFERFADGAVAIEASTPDNSIIVQLDFDEVKRLAEFLGGLIGMVSA